MRGTTKNTGQILTLPNRTIQLINAGALGFQLVWKYVKTDYRNDPVKYSLNFLLPNLWILVRCGPELVENHKSVRMNKMNSTWGDRRKMY